MMQGLASARPMLVGEPGYELFRRSKAVGRIDPGSLRAAIAKAKAEAPPVSELIGPAVMVPDGEGGMISWHESQKRARAGKKLPSAPRAPPVLRRAPAPQPLPVMPAPPAPRSRSFTRRRRSNMRDFRAEALSNILSWYQGNAPDEFARLRAHLAARYGYPNSMGLSGLGAEESGGGFFASIGGALRDAAGWYVGMKQSEELQKQARDQATTELAIAQAGAQAEAERVREIGLQREYMRQAQELAAAAGGGALDFVQQNWIWMVAGLGVLWFAIR